MDDYISRQAAIDAVRDRMGKGETKIGDTFIECFEMILNALPSAQPYTDEEIQKIQDLEQAQFDTMYELGKQAAQEDLQPTCNKLATDCISRQDVLNWLNDEWDGMVLSVFDGIRNFPSAQQEPQWIPCSERLPSEGENVLLCNTLFGNVAIGKLIRYNTSCCWEVDHWDCDIEDWQAWMPLPEPWRGEQ